MISPEWLIVNTCTIKMIKFRSELSTRLRRIHPRKKNVVAGVKCPVKRGIVLMPFACGKGMVTLLPE